jgi:hypothetical protein
MKIKVSFSETRCITERWGWHKDRRDYKRFILNCYISSFISGQTGLSFQVYKEGSTETRTSIITGDQDWIETHLYLSQPHYLLVAGLSLTPVNGQCISRTLLVCVTSSFWDVSTLCGSSDNQAFCLSFFSFSVRHLPNLLFPSWSPSWAFSFYFDAQQANSGFGTCFQQTT